jgi:hypothetical protein
VSDLPGEPLVSGFTFRPASEMPPLSPEARARVLAKIAAVRHARLRALAAASTAVIGHARQQEKK